MKWDYYKACLGEPVKGKKKGDLTPLFYNAKVFRNLVNDLAKPFSRVKFDKVACIDALGFVIGSGVACKLKKGFITIRKGGSLPIRKTDLIRKSFVDYSGKKKSLEINKSAVVKGERFLVVDDWVETGTQSRVAIELIEKLGGEVVGISTIGIDPRYDLKYLEKYNLVSVR